MYFYFRNNIIVLFPTLHWSLPAVTHEHPQTHIHTQKHTHPTWSRSKVFEIQLLRNPFVVCEQKEATPTCRRVGKQQQKINKKKEEAITASWFSNQLSLFTIAKAMTITMLLSRSPFPPVSPCFPQILTGWLGSNGICRYDSGGVCPFLTHG